MDFRTLDLESNKMLSMDHPSRNMEDIGAEGNLNCGGLDQEVSEGRVLDTILWYFGREYAAFCCYLSSYLLQAKLKSCRLMCLAEEISRQFSIGCAMLSLAIIPMKIYGEKEQAGQRNTKCTVCEGQEYQET